MKTSDYVKIKSVNPLYWIIDKIVGHFEEKNGNKYLTLDSTDKNKELLKKYAELWDGIKISIENVNNKLSEHEKKFMKIKFNSDNDLPFKKKH